MTNKPTGGPAHPTIEANGVNNGEPGLTIRDAFAIAALQGALAYPNAEIGGYEQNEKYAAYAYAMADAMLLEREK